MKLVIAISALLATAFIAIKAVCNGGRGIGFLRKNTEGGVFLKIRPYFRKWDFNYGRKSGKTVVSINVIPLSKNALSIHLGEAFSMGFTHC